MSSVVIPYGDSKLAVQIPAHNLLAYLTPNAVEVAADPAGEIVRSIEMPIDTVPLREAASGCRSALIVADDITRTTPVHIVLPVLIDALNEAGLTDDEISVMIALGTHRPMTDREIVDRFGSWVTDRVEVRNSPWQDRAQLVDLGTTANGTPIQVARQAVESDFVIGVGSIVPHHIIGFSGGAKIIQPGISGAVTTGATHHLSIRSRHSYLGIVENPIREEMEEIGDRIGLNAILNVVVDSGGRLVEAVYGDPRKAFRAGVEVSRSVYGVVAPGKADIVVAGSHPCDIEMWQAHKALYAADRVVREGGSIIEVAPCYEGISVSHPEVLDFLAHSSDEIAAMLSDGSIENVVAGAVSMAWARMRERVDIALISEGIGREDTLALGFAYHKTVEEALQAALDKHGQDASVIVLTHAPDMLPLLKS